MRVEENLPGTTTIISQFLLQMHNKKILGIENEGQIIDAAQYSHSFDCKYVTSYLTAIVVFALSHRLLQKILVVSKWEKYFSFALSKLY